MVLLMPKHPFESRGIDPDFGEEYAAALDAGFEIALYDHEAVIRGEIGEACRHITSSGTALLRGWMMKPEQYSTLFDHLLAKGLRLITNPVRFKYCHYLPEWYPALSHMTARSVWAEGLPPEMDACLSALSGLGSRQVIVKDYVKSWKHDWLDACFIPETADKKNVCRVINNFVQAQGTDLNGGVVLRDFLNLRSLGVHPESGMPLSVEFRVFVLGGEVLCTIPYWPEIATSETLPPEVVLPLLAMDLSPFYTADFAQTEQGNWVLMEIGDGQVSGLQGMDPMAFYGSLREKAER